MDLELTREFARAVTLDITQNPRMMQMLDYLVKEAPPEDAALLVKAVRSDLINELEDSTLPAKFPRTRLLFRKLIEQHSGVVGMGQDWLATAISSVAGAVTAIYVGRAQIDAQEKIAELQAAQKLKEAEAARLAAEAKAKEAEAAIKAASILPMGVPPGQEVIPSTPAIPAEAGLPSWVLPVGAAVAVGTIIYLVMRAKR